MNRLKGKTVLITGATAGIGQACALEFARQGCNLILTGRRKERLEDLSKSILEQFKVIVAYEVFDIREVEACREFVQNLALNIDVLINNAGLAKGVDPIQSGDFEDWNTMIDTNIKGVLAMSRFIAPKMLERNSGHIINIGSTAGYEAYPGGSVYCATKHAVKAITEATKKDLHGTKIRVSMVSPGLVETEFSNIRFDGDTDRAKNVYKGMQPLTAEDIAEIVVFVAGRPDHVNVLDSIIMPVYQSSAQMVHRDE